MIATPDNATILAPGLDHPEYLCFGPDGAIDPTQTWLYVAQSTAWNVVRVPLDQPNGSIEVTHTLPPHSVPDGLAFTDDGRLLIACYRPDVIYLGSPDGHVEVLVEDLTAELLCCPPMSPSMTANSSLPTSAAGTSLPCLLNCGPRLSIVRF